MQIFGVISELSYSMQGCSHFETHEGSCYGVVII